MKGMLGLARYGTAHVAAAILAACFVGAVTALLYVALLARAVYWHQAVGRPVAVAWWPLLTGLGALLAILLVFAPAAALADGVFRRRKTDLSWPNLALALATSLLGTGPLAWLAATATGVPLTPFLSVWCSLVAPGFAIHWVTLHVMDGTLAFAGSAVSTTLEYFGWSRN
jgi:hypothetical protein